MGNESSDYSHIRKRGQKEKTITVMKTIKELATKAAIEMVFESKEKLKMIEVTIDAMLSGVEIKISDIP